jgi:hypothetical protein
MLMYQFPTNLQLDILTQEYIIQREQFIGAQIVPLMEVGVQRVRWDERDKERGMTAPHAMDSDPKIDKRPGSTLREYAPIPFKESDLIKESEILQARELGTLANVVNLDRMVALTMKARMDKTFIRAEWLTWKMLTGGFSIAENGVTVAETFPVQTYPTAKKWSNNDTAIPLKDFNAIKLLFRGTGASAKGARAYLNQTTMNTLLENTNDKDIHGLRSKNFVSPTFDLDQVNTILGDRGLPELVVYDEGFYDDNLNFTTFIPDGMVVIVGKRQMGQVVANFISTPTIHRVANGLPAAGFFSFIEINGGPNNGAISVDVGRLGQAANPNIKLTGGVYGGPVLWYPKSIVVMDTTAGG